MNKELYEGWKTLRGKAALDQFFENYETDPDWLTPDGNPTDEEIKRISDFEEAARQQAELNNLNRLLESNLDHMQEAVFRTMQDTAFARTGDKILSVLSRTRREIKAAIDEKAEEILVLTYGRTPWR